MLRFLREAFATALSWLGGFTALIPIFAIAPVGFALHWIQASAEDLLGEWNVFLVYGIQATGAAFAALYVAALVHTPHRRLKTSRDELRAELEVAKSRLSEKDVHPVTPEQLRRMQRFPIWMAACLTLGITPRRPLPPAAEVRLSEIKHDVMHSTIWPSFNRSDGTTYAQWRVKLEMDKMLTPDRRAAEVAKMEDDLKIDRKALRKLAEMYGMEIAGVTDREVA